MEKLNSIPSSPFAFVGPSLDHGPLPAFFYFSLSKEDSLITDPFNQCVTPLSNLPLRIFSATLPEHGSGKDPVHALQAWADHYKLGKDILTPFIEETAEAIKQLIPTVVLQDKCVVGGLSRGGFIACHVSAKLAFLKHILLLAPLTHLSKTQEFTSIPSIHHFDLTNQVELLVDKTLHGFIGNRDTRVGTGNVFAFLQQLVELGHQRRVRGLPFTLNLVPSIGFQGHGTSKTSFQEGAEWVKNILL